MISKSNIRITGENVVYLSSPPTYGHLLKGRRLGGGSIFSCRESFEYRWRRRRMIGFALDAIDIKMIDLMWTKIEDRLKLRQRSVFHRTNYHKAIMVTLSPFWVHDCASRAMATLMLRMAACHYHGDWEKAMLRYDLAKRSRRAVERYLDGYTKWVGYNYRKAGRFCDYFSSASNDFLKLHLVKPPTNPFQ